MPAYRSAAEAEIRDAVVARIREHRPGARIIHEINASSYGNRIDLIAVDRMEIIAFEIKSAKDKLDRLPAQMEAMKGVAHHAIAAIHERFLVEKETHAEAAHYEREGAFYLRERPAPYHYDGRMWVFPERRRCINPDWHDHMARWQFPAQRLDVALPWSALHLLWRDELYDLCVALRISVSRRTTMDQMIQQLRWLCTGKELTRGICAMLRARRCPEADPAIVELAA